MPLKIGCCGFPVGRRQYAACFSVVEVQQTFYQPPRVERGGGGFLLIYISSRRRAWAMSMNPPKQANFTRSSRFYGENWRAASGARSRMSSAGMISFIWEKWALSCSRVSGAAIPHLSQGAMIFLARLMGMAKPMPWPWAEIMEFRPITRPLMSTKGPPLLPGLMEASVWMKSP